MWDLMRLCREGSREILGWERRKLGSADKLCKTKQAIWLWRRIPTTDDSLDFYFICLSSNINLCPWMKLQMHFFCQGNVFILFFYQTMSGLYLSFSTLYTLYYSGLHINYIVIIIFTIYLRENRTFLQYFKQKKSVRIGSRKGGHRLLLPSS